MRTYKRQKAGQPTGGQFATHLAAFADSSVVLDDTDPWADLDDVLPDPEPDPQPEPATPPVADETLPPEPPAPAPEPVIGMGLEAERQLISDLNVAMGYAPPIDDMPSYIEVRDRVLEKYGTFEQAVIAVGHSVKARAEHAAGITGDEVRASWVERSEESHKRLEALRDQIAAEPNHTTAGFLYQESRDLTGAHLALGDASDPQTKADLRRLADGYQAALSDLRPLGGQMDWHERTKDDARRLFDEAAQVYPTDWIDASNARRTGRNGYPIGKALARVSKARAHYSEGNYAKTRKKVARESYGLLLEEKEAELERYGRSATPYFEYRELTDEDLRNRPSGSSATHVVTRYEISRVYDPAMKPRGPRWELWTDPADESRMYWRRPAMKMQTLSSESAPELTTNIDTSRAEGRPAGFSISVHELAHRFERSVPDMTALEDAFLTRRTTDEHGNREPLVRLYKGSREYAYKDSFPTAYMGKVYDHGSREIMSMGVEAMFGGNHGGLVGAGKYSADDEYRAFVLGVMATLPGRRVGDTNERN